MCLRLLLAVDGVHRKLLSGRKQRNLQRIRRNRRQSVEHGLPVSCQLSYRYSASSRVGLMTDQGRTGSYQGSFSGLRTTVYLFDHDLLKDKNLLHSWVRVRISPLFNARVSQRVDIPVLPVTTFFQFLLNVAGASESIANCAALTLVACAS